MLEQTIPIKPNGIASIAKPIIGKIQSKAVILPIKIEAIPISLIFFGIKFFYFTKVSIFSVLISGIILILMH